MHHAPNCNCKCAKDVVQVRLKLHGSQWIDSLSYDPADAAFIEVSDLFVDGKIDIANGGVIAVETKKNGKIKRFIVERKDVSLFHSKAV